MIGLSRIGKSTLYNFINNVQLVGNKEKGKAKVVYVPRVTNTQTAEANSGASSVTLLPNMTDKGDYTLMDMPGYLDKRNYNAVVGVSYVLKAAFEKVKECQFVLVLTQMQFDDAGFFFKGLRGFYNMFDFDKI